MDFGEVKEGKVTVKTSEGTFYNPHMELSRDISSLAVAAVQLPLPDAREENGEVDAPLKMQKLRICDGMSATGIRGIRYAAENSNVESVTFVDMDEPACELIAENAKRNGLQDFAAFSGPQFRVVADDINHHLYRGGEKFNFVELDPFGSPVPFVRSALLNLRASKHGILSVTATDMAVLCGAHQKACLINYQARPLHTFFCHEVAVRIMAGHIVRVAAPMHLGIKPLLLLSNRHYVKCIFEVRKSAAAALDSMNMLGYASFCPACLDIRTFFKPMIPPRCELCAAGGPTGTAPPPVEWGGPMWLGELHDKGTIERMQAANQERQYRSRAEIANMLMLMKGELGMPAFYYDVHSVADHFNKTSRPFDQIISSLQDKGFAVARTHFNGLALKTDAPAAAVRDAVNA